MDLNGWSTTFRLLSDPTRVRLLHLLERDELTVAELSQITQLAQPRVSTHLAKLKEAGFVRDRRAGVSAYYRFAVAELDSAAAGLWQYVFDSTDDGLLRQDARRLPEVLARRASDSAWADSVAGDMERHYSPGRTWETLARAMLQILDAGDVLDVASGDGVLAELLSPSARSITCVDASERVCEAARQRLAERNNVRVECADMHALPLPDASIDLALQMHALTYSRKPALAIAEAARVLRRGGRLLACTLNRHDHAGAVEPFGHANLGFTPAQLGKLAEQAGLSIVRCAVISREKRPPHFEIVCLIASKP